MPEVRRTSEYHNTLYDQIWVAPSMDKEFGELEGASEHLGIPIDILTEAFEHGKMIDLPRKSWIHLKNADSRDESWKTLEEIDKHLSNRGSQPRDVYPIADAMKVNEPLPAPIVLQRGDEQFLIAGNTRLLAARALERYPRVFLIEVEK